MCERAITVAAFTLWLSCNTLVSHNIVNLRQARLVPGWVTVFGRVNHLGAEPAGTHVYTQPEPFFVGKLE